jgi:ribonucleoside-diphosphate reductase alpha chain
MSDDGKTFSYEEALTESLNYFGGDELAARVVTDKYLLRGKRDELYEKSPLDKHQRMAREFARIEKRKFKKPLSEGEIFALFDRYRYIVPQGSPMFGIGNKYQIISLSNCYLLNVPQDSYSSILKVDQQLVNISKRRGGVGIDLSELRPEGTETNNAALTSTGVCSWMERYSNSIREVGQNGRRGALMLTISVHHPDILKFATIKNDDLKVTGANISVRLTREFLDAVENDTEYELRWPVQGKPKISRMIRAREVWDAIINSAWLRAEPGLLMWDNMLTGPADCYPQYRSRGTNPCSEIPLSELDSCRLMCLNLLSYVDNPFTRKARFNSALFYEHAQIAQRLMDDLVDLESEKIEEIIAKIASDPEDDETKRPELEMWKQIKYFNDNGRRTGLGVTAVGDMLAALGIKYGSDSSVDCVGDVYRLLKLGAYRSSVDMAKELGHFTEFSREAEKDCLYLRQFENERVVLSDDSVVDGSAIYADMQKYGRRNVALLTTAPTGSVSCLTRTTSGIEPAFMLSYTRRKKITHNDDKSRVDFVDKLGDKWQEFTVYHPQVAKWMEVTGETDLTKSPYWGCTADEIDWIQRVKLQAAAQQHVCHAISSTINLPENVTKEKVAEIYTTAFKMGLKGITVYRKNCRSGVLVEKKTEGREKSARDAEKRPTILECDIYHFTASQKEYFVLVGLLDGKPYEVFMGDNIMLFEGDDDSVKRVVSKRLKSGEIERIRRGLYKLYHNDTLVCEDLAARETEEVEGLCRMTSIALRHKAPLEFIVQQLEKMNGSMYNPGRLLSRALKRYLKDGTAVSGEECPECQGGLVRSEGCAKCQGCGWTKCL